ncbi:stalk domain-containing protein [Pelotomaculum propionicicum]|uniref:stalk domain-containing protein n=1 Tax=Pelotomaculum propionicicum TaxID=258475 RepID=UPI003B7D762E
MKKNRYFLLALTVIICFGVVFSASAASQITAKQMLIDRLQSSDFIPTGDINKTSSGTAYYQIKTLSGVYAATLNPVAKLAGADLKMDYTLDTPENKMAINYIVNYDGAKYSGGMFMDNGRFIMTTEFLSLLNSMQSGIIPEGKELPPYVYMDNQAYNTMWGNLNSGQYIPPELKELMVFFVEAVPEKYFTVSLVDQQVSFALDQNGFEDVTLAVLSKVANERDRFASLVADYMATSGGQQQAADMIKSELLKSIEQGVNDGSYPDTAAEVKNMMAGIVELKELKYQASIISPGQNSFNMTLGLGGGPEFSGQVVVKSDFTSGKDLLSGTYSVDFKANAGTENISVSGAMQGEFNQTGLSSKSNDTIKINVQDYNTGTSLLDLLIEGHADAAADPEVRVNIPVLTPANSMDLMKMMNNTPAIILNGAPVAFDVAPFIVPVENGSRILVPLRNLAEALGCEVGWVEPDQINIVRGDKTINMFINKTGYLVNGEEKQLDAPPFIMGDRTMVPLRFVAEELGCTVEYDSATNTVNIYSN